MNAGTTESWLLLFCVLAVLAMPLIYTWGIHVGKQEGEMSKEAAWDEGWRARMRGIWLDANPHRSNRTTV